MDKRGSHSPCRARARHAGVRPQTLLARVLLVAISCVFSCGAPADSPTSPAPVDGKTPEPALGSAAAAAPTGAAGVHAASIATAGAGALPVTAPLAAIGQAGAAAPQATQTAGGSTAGSMLTAAAAPERLPDTYYGQVWSPAGISTECQGFMLEGLRYSPGGSRLPNRCAAFDPTRNNPYAVRCIDAWANYKSGFPGDNSCILPPPPELGVQIGAHPQTTAWFEQVAAGNLSGYEHPSDDWIVQAGEEETISYRTSSSNKEPSNYYRIYYRMRPGSHHMGISANDDPSSQREVWLPGSTIPAQFDPLLGETIATLGAIQRPDDNNPVTLEKPAEDAGLYNILPAGTAIILNMHHFNLKEQPLLKEVWINVFFESDARYQVFSLASIPVDQAVGLAVPAGQTLDLHYSWSISEPLRVVTLYAHRHAWTPNFSAWIERAQGGRPEIVYQSFDWSDVPTYRYDSLTRNPAPSAETRSDGAHSGMLELHAGDQLHFNCHITFTDERAAAIGLPKTAREIGTLTFANEAYTAEMCSLLGGTVNGRLPISTARSTRPPPSFASME